VREALVEMVYETTHLSPENEDGSHLCIIPKHTLEKARAALASTPPQVKTDAGAWRTMESAPRDGNSFLAYDVYGEIQHAWFDEGEFRSWEKGRRIEIDVWQPLPTPPQVKP
jgi:hypothetical protein